MAVVQQTVFAPRHKRMSGNCCEASRSSRHLYPAPCDCLTGMLIVQDRPPSFPTNHVDGKLDEAPGRSNCPTIHTLASLNSPPSTTPFSQKPEIIPFPDHSSQTSEVLIEGQSNDSPSSGGLRLRKGAEALPCSESRGGNDAKPSSTTFESSIPSIPKSASEPCPRKKIESVLVTQLKVGPGPDHACEKRISKQSLKQLHQL